MLDFLNAIDETAWAGIGGAVAAIIGAVALAFRGAKKTPVEVGNPAPATDMAPYVLEEVRELQHGQGDMTEMLRAIERTATAIHQDTQILRDRGRR